MNLYIVNSVHSSFLKRRESIKNFKLPNGKQESINVQHAWKNFKKNGKSKMSLGFRHNILIFWYANNVRVDFQEHHNYRSMFEFDFQGERKIYFNYGYKDAIDFINKDKFDVFPRKNVTKRNIILNSNCYFA